MGDVHQPQYLIRMTETLFGTLENIEVGLGHK